MILKLCWGWGRVHFLLKIKVPQILISGSGKAEFQKFNVGELDANVLQDSL